MKKEKYLITGGAGFIGSNIAKELVRLGHRVKVIDNLSAGKKANLKDIINQIEFVKGDICNLKLLEKEFRGFDFVLHQAALCSVPGSIADPIKTTKINIEGTLNVLLASKNAKIKQVVFASSSSVYGDNLANYQIEEKTGNLLSPYALSKKAGENYCQIFNKLFGVDTVILRYFNVFGPNQDPNSQYAAVVPKFIQIMVQGKRPVIYGSGNQNRDFTYVDNIVYANILATKSFKAKGEIINIACAKSITLNQLVKAINQELKNNIKPIYQKARPGDIMHSKANIDKARSLLDFKPTIDFEIGLKETIKWYKNKT